MYMECSFLINWGVMSGLLVGYDEGRTAVSPDVQVCWDWNHQFCRITGICRYQKWGWSLQMQELGTWRLQNCVGTEFLPLKCGRTPKWRFLKLTKKNTSSVLGFWLEWQNRKLMCGQILLCGTLNQDSSHVWYMLSGEMKQISLRPTEH